MEVKAKQVEIEKASAVLKLLGDKTRLSMIKILEKNDCCVCEFVDLFNISQPAVSQHLRKLRDVGLVKEERRGKWVFFSLNRENEIFELITPILKVIPSQDERIDKLEKQGLRISCE